MILNQQKDLGGFKGPFLFQTSIEISLSCTLLLVVEFLLTIYSMIRQRPDPDGDGQIQIRLYLKTLT